MLQGIDISSWQHPNGAAIDWPTVAQHVDFVLVKATEGTIYTNPYFAADFAAVAAQGRARGCFHYAKFGLNSPEAEADYFISVVGPLLGSYDVLALDLEEGDGAQADNAARWLGRVTAALGPLPWLYSGDWYARPHGLYDARLVNYGPWWAAPGTTPPPMGQPWRFAACWQYGVGRVPGIAEVTDLDVFNGTLDQFRLYGKEPPTPKPIRQPTNDDLVQCARYLLAQPPDLDGLAGYIEPFVDGGIDAPSTTTPRQAAAQSQPRGAAGRFVRRI